MAEARHPHGACARAAGRVQVDETVSKLRHTTHPVWIMAHRNGGDYYGFPQFGDQPGFKIGRMHHLREQVDPDAVRREVNTADIDILREVVADCFPCANGRVLNSSTCLFTNTPDCHFLIDLHPSAPNVRALATPLADNCPAVTLCRYWCRGGTASARASDGGCVLTRLCEAVLWLALVWSVP